MKTPKVSVVMTVFNAEKYLRASIKSILDQTYGDFEFIIIDDGSTDTSAGIIRSYTDPRIVFKSRKNKGQTASLNEALKMAQGEYIARQDADDISVANRLEKQVTFLDDNPDVGLLGANYDVVYENGDTWFTTNLFTHPHDVKLALLFANQFGHGTAMFRRHILSDCGVYDESFRITQDYDLWCRIARQYSVANLKDSLYIWRYYPESLSTSNADLTQQEVDKVRAREFHYFIKHRSQFKLQGFHSFSTASGLKKYCEMKSGVYRNLSLLYTRKQNRSSAFAAALRAIIVAPWKSAGYRYLFIFLYKKSSVQKLQYDNYIQ